MDFKAEEFKPTNPSMEIDGMEIKLSLFTLNITVELQEHFGDLPEMFALIEKKPEIILDIVWRLVLDKSLFNNRKSEFSKLIQAKPLKELGMELMSKLNECVTKSMPLVINKKRSDEINKIKGNEVVKPCYSKYYDALAKRYGGMNLESFYSLTLRQISAMMTTISDASYSELELKASLAGRKLKPRIVYNEVSEEEEKEQEEDALEAVARLQKAYEEKTKNKDK